MLNRSVSFAFFCVMFAIFDFTQTIFQNFLDALQFSVSILANPVFVIASYFEFRYNDVDKCHICMGIFIDLDSILGLIYIILRFMHIFLRSCSILACSGFDCRFVRRAKCQERGEKLRPTKSREVAKEVQSAQDRRSKAKPRESKRYSKTHRAKKLQPSGQRPPQPGRGGCHGLTVVAATAVVVMVCPCCSVFLHAFSFFCAIFRFLLLINL